VYSLLVILLVCCSIPFPFDACWLVVMSASCENLTLVRRDTSISGELVVLEFLAGNLPRTSPEHVRVGHVPGEFHFLVLGVTESSSLGSHRPAVIRSIRANINVFLGHLC
jgi:hypothetical protein